MNETRTKRDLLETMEKLNKENKKNHEQKEEACQAFLKMSRKIYNISPGSSRAFAFWGLPSAVIKILTA